MAYAFYRKENQTLGQTFGGSIFHHPELNNDDIIKLTGELCRIYEVDTPRITFTGRRWCRVLFDQGRINFGNGGMPFTLVVHEIAHWIRFKKANDGRHNKELLSLIIEMIPVAQKYALEKLWVINYQGGQPW